MNEHRPVHARIPGMGQRSVKTALATTLVALMYLLIFPDRNPTFACIGAVFGMGSDMDNSWLNGGNRLIGTIIGGFLGMGLFWVEHAIFPAGNYYFRLPLIFIGVMMLVCASVLFHWPGAVQPGGVVLCIILFNTPVETYISYSVFRMIDTGVGVAAALVINWYFTRERVERILTFLHLPHHAEAPAEAPVSTEDNA